MSVPVPGVEAEQIFVGQACRCLGVPGIEVGPGERKQRFAAVRILLKVSLGQYQFLPILCPVAKYVICIRVWPESDRFMSEPDIIESEGERGFEAGIG